VSSSPDGAHGGDPTSLYQRAAERAARAAAAHETYAAFLEQHGDPAAADDHRRRSGALWAQATRYREQAATSAPVTAASTSASDTLTAATPAVGQS
jgi:hypothetical protein